MLCTKAFEVENKQNGKKQQHHQQQQQHQQNKWINVVIHKHDGY